jgi:GH25 family lysozyme M1 (1,4-beta-N-acetylmuramidase)
VPSARSDVPARPQRSTSLVAGAAGLAALVVTAVVGAAGSAAASTTSSPSPSPSPSASPSPMASSSPSASPSSTPTSTPAPPPRPAGPDISGYQHPGGAKISWAQVKASGQRFVFIKASEGTYYDSSYFGADAAGARQSGLIVGAYHFGRPGGAASAAAQARHLVSVAGLGRTDATLPLVLDLEDNGGLTPSALHTWIASFLSTAKALTGRTPILYTYVSFWRNQMAGDTSFATYPLWEARYSTHYDQIGGWKSPTFWQYTDAAAVSGISGGVDRSYCLGSSEALTALARGSNASSPTAARTAAAPVSAVQASLVDGALRVSWQRSTDNGGYAITNYEVEVTHGSSVVRYTRSGQSSSLSDAGYQTGVTYQVRVRALNAAGGSSWRTVSAPSLMSTQTAATLSAAVTAQGGIVTVTGASTRGSSHAAAVGRTLTLSRSIAGGAWTKLMTVVTNSAGKASVSTRLTRNTRYRYVLSTGGYEQPSQGVVGALCRPSVHVSGASTGRVGQALRLTLTSSAAVNAQTAVLQAYTSAGWRSVSSAGLRLASGHLRASTSYTPRVKGRLRLRLVSRSDGSYTSATSPELHVSVA